MECPGCQEWIHLPFKTRAAEMVCPGCTEVIPVKDLYVAAGPFLIARDVLFKSVPRYRRLILEAEKEAAGLKNSEKVDNISLRSMKMFINNLKELLDGCRDEARHALNDNGVEYSINRLIFQGNIVNLSVSGVCIDGKNVSLDRLWKEITVHLKRDEVETCAIRGRVVWIGDGNKMGVKFLTDDEKTRDAIEDYIREKSLFGMRR
ncbi:MAG: PilZ domain-containing protein [Deltaproteobacteria bacterium]|nr:PilZ domain-containing protein [Deltaproteobacteria bacterium]